MAAPIERYSHKGRSRQDWIETAGMSQSLWSTQASVNIGAAAAITETSLVAVSATPSITSARRKNNLPSWRCDWNDGMGIIWIWIQKQSLHKSFFSKNDLISGCYHTKNNNKIRWYIYYFSTNTHYFFLKIERQTLYMIFFLLPKNYYNRMCKVWSENKHGAEIIMVGYIYNMHLKFEIKFVTKKKFQKAYIIQF